jgi:hypothetical protein
LLRSCELVLQKGRERGGTVVEGTRSLWRTPGKNRIAAALGARRTAGSSPLPLASHCAGTMLPTDAPEAQRLDAFMVHSCTEFSSFPPSCTRRSCWSKSSGGSQRATKALLVTLLAFAAPFLASAQNFTCCTSPSSGCSSSNYSYSYNDPATCAALGDLYAATNGAGWYTSSQSSDWDNAAAGTATDYCTFRQASGGHICNSTGALTWLCVHSLCCP